MKNTGNKNKVILFVFILAIVIVAAYFISNYYLQMVSGNEITVKLYFIDQTTNELTSEERTIKDGKTDFVIKQVLEGLIEGPKSSSNLNPIPKDISLTAELSDNDVTIDFAGDYQNLKPSEEVLCRASIVWTLTELDNISSVKFSVNGKELVRQNGQPFGEMTRSEIELNPPIKPGQQVEHTFVLYFSNADATKLVPEKRTISVDPQQPLEKYIIEQLIEGPKEPDHYPTVPTETKLKKVETNTEVCYVDLSSDFVTKHNGGSTGELMTIYSIVNSLTELSHINKVQFYIEGEKQDEFKGHVSFGQPFERNTDLEF